MPRKKTEKLYRVWIELEKPVSDEHGAELAQLANNMIQRLACGERVDTFWWSTHERRYCYGGDGAYTVLTDNGQWFDLEELGRAR